MSSKRQALDPLGVVAGEPVGDARAAVVAGDGEAFEAQCRHCLDLVLRQGALAVIFAVWAGRRFRAVAVAAQIGDHEGKFAGQARRHLAPHQMRLRIAVQ